MSVTVPVEPWPPVTAPGFTVIPPSCGAPPWPVTVRDAVSEFLDAAVSVTGMVAETFAVPMGKEIVELPEGMITEVGTVTAGLPDARYTMTPCGGAGK